MSALAWVVLVLCRRDSTKEPLFVRLLQWVWRDGRGVFAWEPLSLVSIPAVAIGEEGPSKLLD